MARQAALFVREYFGELLMDAARKDDAIARIVEREKHGDRRTWMYREWCAALRVPVLASDLRRVRAGRWRELQRALFPEA
jgi:hypothetical protein